MEVAIAAFLRPFLLLVLLVVVARPLAWGLYKIWPDGKLKRIFYDKTLVDSDPGLYMLFWFLIVIVFMVVPAWIALSLYG